MFVPISTDAPVYHWPWVTLSLIVANVTAFILMAWGAGDSAEAWNGWALQLGDGLHPMQWIGCNFVHFDEAHLIANMFFLWVFGLVVEGKTGWWKYLLIYFGIGAAHALIQQLLMLGYEGDAVSGGASGVIFGLMAISLAWAPKNEVSFIFLFWYRLFVFDVAVWKLSVFYFGLQVVFAALNPFALSSEVIHLLGAAIGFGIGVGMLKRNWVDCENWDLFAVMSGTYGSRAELEPVYFADQNDTNSSAEKGEKKTRGSQPAGQLPGSDRAATLGRMQYCLERGMPAAALDEYRRMTELDPEGLLDGEDLRKLALSLYDSKLWDSGIPILEQYVARFPDDIPMRLKLAAVLVEIGQRPRYALRVLEPIPNDTLDERRARHRRRIETRAQSMIDAGVLELEGRQSS